MSRMRNWSDSDSSSSTNSRSFCRDSTSVTWTPTAASMQAYSVPITPPPTMMRLLGRVARFSSSFVSITRPSANGTLAGRAGSVPTATSTYFPFSSVASTLKSSPASPASPASSASSASPVAPVAFGPAPDCPRVTRTVCGSTNAASPATRWTPLRVIWLRMTSTSVLTTWRQR